jgi:hypothetical protein
MAARGATPMTKRNVAAVCVEGRALLQRHFEDVVSSDGNIKRTFTNDYGDNQVRDSLFAGPGGFLHFETTWQITDGGLRLTTVIPKGGP